MDAHEWDVLHDWSITIAVDKARLFLFYLLYKLGTEGRTLEAEPVPGVYHKTGNLSKNLQTGQMP